MRWRVLFVLPSLAGGGTERIIFYILKYLNRERFIPYLVLFEKKGTYLDFMPDDICVYNLNQKSRVDFFKLIFRLAYIIYPKVKADVVISSLEHANLITLLARVISPVKKPVVINERNYPSLYHQKYGGVKQIRRLLLKKCYPKANKIITVSKGIRKDLETSFGIPNKKMLVIYNGTDLAYIKYSTHETVNDISWFKEGIPTIAACGTLTRQKNYPLLIEAFARVQKNTRVRLLILGEGEERTSLEKLACRLGIQDKVVFLGFQKNPFKYMAKATIFVLSSLWEGFPNVIIEAMACGTPVISTRCPSGPDEIITDGVNGLLVPVGDVDALAEAIMRLLKDEPLRKRLAEAGRKRAANFKVEEMVVEYEKVFKEIIEDRQK